MANTNPRYAKAKKVLNAAARKGLVLLRYWNGYKNSNSLKVFWHCSDLAARAEVIKLHETLVKLADRTREGERGGDIYNFKKEQ